MNPVCPVCHLPIAEDAPVHLMIDTESGDVFAYHASCWAKRDAYDTWRRSVMSLDKPDARAVRRYSLPIIPTQSTE